MTEPMELIPDIESDNFVVMVKVTVSSDVGKAEALQAVRDFVGSAQPPIIDTAIIDFSVWYGSG